MNETLGNKAKDPKIIRTDLPTWQWVNPTYSFTIPKSKAQIISVEIDPLQRTADVNRKNNIFLN